MKGQFMMISAIIAGLITISAVSTISTASNTRYEVSHTASHLDQIRSESSEFDFSQQGDRTAFRELAESYEGYSAETTYWSGPDCLNLTLNTASGSYSYSCLSGR